MVFEYDNNNYELLINKYTRIYKILFEKQFEFKSMLNKRLSMNNVKKNIHI